MRPLVKPLAAVVALSLVTSASAVMSPKYSGSTSSCGPVLDTKMSRAMNVNSPTRSVGSCWQDRFAYGGDVLLYLQREDDMDKENPMETYLLPFTLHLLGGPRAPHMVKNP